ncbi:hypothetical protein K461DRAFT_293992 [Myriangium duriaei CBS 260.36]|uniref:Large ribosomal subunit protein uL23m n=1 Tax=Myriangium duriaei CBS 260.36 TaxID=1168546 RepID=A0A9P4IYP3_9PEZI|nr:hypothetical protein K461DRAFT_293992 [Myriangium duriaei CBS 260.36]
MASLAPTTARTARNIARTSPFKLGQKEIYLPDFTVILKRTRLPPQYATFEVPLEMNKLDLRDYLWHAYSIRTLGITSRILPNAVQESRPGVERPVKTLFRPAPTKKMTVLMERPFVWPAPPSKEVMQEAFNTEQFRAAGKEQEKASERMRMRDAFVDREERGRMREQARRLVEGKEGWRPPGRRDGSWAVRKGGGES